MTEIKEIKSEVRINKGGRPKVWTEEKIADVALKIVKWAEESNAFALIQFCRKERIVPSKLSDLTKESEVFREALSYVKSILADKMIVSINSKDGRIHPAFFNKYIRLNDTILDMFMKDQEKVDNNEIAQNIVKIIDFSNIKKKSEKELDEDK